MSYRATRTKTMSKWSYKHWKTHAELLASQRSRCWSDTQLQTLDELVGRFIDIYHEDAPSSFDPEWFAQEAKRWYDRARDTLILEDQHE